LSFAPTLLGQSGQKEHEFLYWEFSETDQMGLRMGDWKLVVIKGVPHLFNLSEDIHEDNDLASARPDLVEKMVKIIHQEHTPSQLFSVTLP
jgi:hypothetical protein